MRISWGGTSKAPVRRSTHLMIIMIMVKEMMVMIIIMITMMMGAPVCVDARENKEKAGAFCSPTSQPEQHSQFFFSSIMHLFASVLLLVCSLSEQHFQFIITCCVLVIICHVKCPFPPPLRSLTNISNSIKLKNYTKQM